MSSAVNTKVIKSEEKITEIKRSLSAMVTMLNGLEQTGGRFGLQTMCEAGGLANATIVERL
jgi:hypothetical protein